MISAIYLPADGEQPLRKQQIVPGDGGDTPESMYSGAMTALNLPWRPGVRKVIIIGDAPGKDPEPVTGFTLAAVQAKALAVDPAQIYAVATSNDSSTIRFRNQ